MNTIDLMTEYIIKKADRVLDDRFVRNAVHWIHAILLNRRRVRLILGDSAFYVNYYGINVAGSRSGKTWVMNKLKPMGIGSNGEYELMLKRHFKEGKSSLYKHSTADPRFLEPIVNGKRESTTQGIHKIAEALQVASLNGGSMNFLIDEMFTTAKIDILEALLEGYDGNYSKPNIKGSEEDTYEEVNDLPTNFFGMSSPEPLFNDKSKKEGFMNMLKTGWFRRSFLVDISDARTKAKRPERNTIPDLINERILTPHTTDITLTPTAEELFYEINTMVMEDETQYAEMKDPYTMLKLAGLRAYGDFRTKITEEDLEYAMNFWEECFIDSKNIIMMEHDFIRIFANISKREMTENELVRSKLLPTNNKLRDGIMLDVDAYAMENNAQLYFRKTQSNTTKFFVRRYAETDGYFKLSYANWSGKKGGKTPMYTKTFEGDLRDLQQLLKEENRQMVQFLLRHRVTTGETNRTMDNVISVGVLFFDFDDGDVKIEEVIHIFGRYKFLARKSSSFTPEKHKFHLVLPLKYQMNMSHDEFRTMYLSIAMKFGLSDYIDISMAKSVQPMYELADVDDYLHFEDKEGKEYELFDPRCCLEGSTQDLTTKKIYGKVNPKNRVIRYIDKMLPDLYEGKREPSTNAFLYTMANTPNKPSHADMMEALEVIIAHIADPKWEKKNRGKFVKFINQNF
jgi:hypothetical protein